MLEKTQLLEVEHDPSTQSWHRASSHQPINNTNTHTLLCGLI